MERYCVARVSGQSQTQAATTAGYEKAPHNVGSRLNKRADVQRRMYELQAIKSPAPDAVNVPANVPNSGQHTGDVTAFVPRERTNKHAVETKQWRTTELVSLYHLTRAMRQYAVAHQCLRTLSLIHGDMDTPKPIDKVGIATLAGVSEMHAMLSQLMQNVPLADRPKLLAQAPELADIVADASCTPTQGV